MNLGYALTLSMLAGMSTLIGALFIFLPIKKEKVNKFIATCLAFSIIIMIGISLIDLMPESCITIIKKYEASSIIIILGLFLISYLFIIVLNRYTQNYESSLYKLGILSMITLILHNFPEGIVTFLTTYIDPSLGLKLTFAIAMHNIPEGIAITVPIYYATGSKAKALSRAFLSGLAEPLGALLAFLFLAKFMSNTLISLILVAVSGLMITLAIEQMLPEALKYKENKSLYLGFTLGIIVLILNFI